MTRGFLCIVQGADFACNGTVHATYQNLALHQGCSCAHMVISNTMPFHPGHLASKDILLSPKAA